MTILRLDAADMASSPCAKRAYQMVGAEQQMENAREKSPGLWR
jgi:hypothetical protein